MSFGSELQSNFHRLTQNHFFNEEVLFAKLDDAFILMKKDPRFMRHIDIIHGDISKINIDLSYAPLYSFDHLNFCNTIRPIVIHRRSILQRICFPSTIVLVMSYFNWSCYALQQETVACRIILLF